MAACCIGGVCIPYSAILPLFIVFLQYLIRPLVKLGLIPSWLAQKLGVYCANDNDKNKTDLSSCAFNASGSKRRGKHDQKSSSCLTETTTSESCCSSSSHYDDASEACVMRYIRDTNEFETLLKQSNVLIVKFTAEWCKPCKAVQPVFQEIANKYYDTMTANVKFAIVDVDELDEVASKYKITMMPTFIAFKDGTYMDSLSGIHASKLETFVKHTVGSK